MEELHGKKRICNRKAGEHILHRQLQLPLTKENCENEDVLSRILIMLPLSEVRSMIFKRLDNSSLLKARQVSKLWQSFVDPLLNFRIILWDHSVEEVLEFASSGLPVDSLIVSKLRNFVYPKDGLKISHVRELGFVPYGNASASVGLSEDNFKGLLQEFSDIECLKLHSAAFKALNQPSYLVDVPLLELKTLEVSTFNRDGRGHPLCGDVFQNYFPKLDSIRLSLINDSNSHSHVPLMYQEIFEFIARHSDTLKDIHLAFENLLEDNLVAELARMTTPLDHPTNNSKFNEIMDKLETVKLQEFIYTPTAYECIVSSFIFGAKLLTSQQCLRKLEIKHIATLELWTIIPQVLSKCNGTIQDVNVFGCLCIQMEDRMPIFNCSCIKNCPGLKKFRFDICGSRISNIEDLPKQLECLALGQGLKRDQIRNIILTLTKLEDLKITQGQSKFSESIPKIDVKIFNSIMKMPSMKTLMLSQKTSSARSIKNKIQINKGIQWSRCLEFNGCYEIKVDPKVFNRRKF